MVVGAVVAAPLVFYGLARWKKDEIFLGIANRAVFVSILLQAMALAFFLLARSTELSLLALAVEGIVCLMMALPLALALAVMGGTVGYAIQRHRPAMRGAPSSLMLLYCVLTQQFVVTLFVAAILPAIAKTSCIAALRATALPSSAVRASRAASLRRTVAPCSACSSRAARSSRSRGFER
jgi:hypothetical protein